MIFLGIGSNLDSKFGDRYNNIRRTLKLIQEEKIVLKKISKFYETPSYPNKKNPKFINIVIEIEYNLDPEMLLKKIFLIEKKMERKRNTKNEPRTCDIDIIDFKGLIKNQKNVVLPHPKMYKRNFVLFPLKEINPQWIHPILNKKIDFFINNLSQIARNEITRKKESVILD
tara:strand:- start:3400 stop:3912 length:513 start_codon:yes stop_codon:yes gene_type:complete